jgi:hypothetical protein
MLYRSILLIAMAVSAIRAQPMFEGASGFGEEKLHGKPKLVTVQREKLGDRPVFLPEDETVYREDGQISSHKHYSEGKLVLNKSFEYDSEGHRSLVTERNPDGNITLTRQYQRQPDQSEQELDSAAGKELSRTVRHFDAHQRVIELNTTDSGGIATIMNFTYDDLGRPIEGRVSMKGNRLYAAGSGPNGLHRQIPAAEQVQIMMRVQILYPSEKRAIVTMYGADAQILLQVETTEDDAGNQMGQILFEHEPQGKSGTSERVEARDPQGNWTLKRLIERDSATQLDQIVARLHRSLAYY